jgi:hypothetical protein
MSFGSQDIIIFILNTGTSPSLRQQSYGFCIAFTIELVSVSVFPLIALHVTLFLHIGNNVQFQHYFFIINICKLAKELLRLSCCSDVHENLMSYYTPPQKSGQYFALSQVENVTMRRFY